jgi:hypothetical protein
MGKKISCSASLPDVGMAMTWFGLLLGHAREKQGKAKLGRR